MTNEKFDKEGRPSKRITQEDITLVTEETRNFVEEEIEVGVGPKARENEVIKLIMESGDWKRNLLKRISSQFSHRGFDFIEFKYGIKGYSFLYIHKDHKNPSVMIHDDQGRRRVPLPHPGATVLLKVDTNADSIENSVTEIHRWED